MHETLSMNFREQSSSRQQEEHGQRSAVRVSAQVLHVQDGNTDVDALRKAIDEAKACTDKPTMIKVSTLIGYGSPNKVNSYAAHGAPLGADETKLTREQLKWEFGDFEVRVSSSPSGKVQRLQNCAATADRRVSYVETHASTACQQSLRLAGFLLTPYELVQGAGCRSR